MYILVYFIISHVLFNYVMIHFRDQRELALFLAHSNSYMHILEITRRPISSIYKDLYGDPQGCLDVRLVSEGPQ